MGRHESDGPGTGPLKVISTGRHADYPAIENEMIDGPDRHRWPVMIIIMAVIAVVGLIMILGSKMIDSGTGDPVPTNRQTTTPVVSPQSAAVAATVTKRVPGPTSVVTKNVPSPVPGPVVKVPVPGPTVTVTKRVPGPTVTKTVPAPAKTVTKTKEVPAPAKTICLDVLLRETNCPPA